MSNNTTDEHKKSLLATAAFVLIAAACALMFPRVGVALCLGAAVMLLAYLLEARGITREESSKRFAHASKNEVLPRVSWATIAWVFVGVSVLNIVALFGWQLPYVGHWLTTGLRPQFEGFAAIAFLALTPIAASKAVRDYRAQWGRFNALDEVLSHIFKLGKDDLQPNHIRLLQDDIADTVYRIGPVPARMREALFNPGIDAVNLAMAAQLPDFMISPASNDAAVYLRRADDEERERRRAYVETGGMLAALPGAATSSVVLPDGSTLVIPDGPWSLDLSNEDFDSQ